MTIFEALVGQLRGLANVDISSGSGSKIVYILNSLATVNTYVLPVILAASGVRGAAEVVMSMFQALILSVHSDHDEEGKHYEKAGLLHVLYCDITLTNH